jgi:hypothetical protein
MILQSDNGNEFNTAAITRKQVGEFCGKLVGLTDLEMSEVITEMRQLWPKCWMVCQSPCHSPSNGGVERVNRTMQEKLGAWIKECKSRQWMIGCCLTMWQYNTQNHHTIGNIPYSLVFGQLPCVGISDLPLYASVLTQLATEAQLNCVCNISERLRFWIRTQQWLRLLTMQKRPRQPIKSRFSPTPTTAITNKFEAAVDNFDNINVTNAADDNLDEIVLEILQKMDEEENSAQVGNSDKENVPLVMVVMDEEPRSTKKSTPSEEISCWHKSVKTKVCLTSIDHPQIEGKFTATPGGLTNLFYGCKD